MENLKLIYRVHALKRMFERNISREDIRSLIAEGKVIEDYPDDSPYPSKLISGSVNGRALHLVLAENKQESEIIIITVYEPDPLKWSEDFTRRNIL